MKEHTKFVIKLVFVELVGTVNNAYYHNVLLIQHLFPAVKRIYDGHFTFQWDSA